jgi:hypothetical protein
MLKFKDKEKSKDAKIIIKIMCNAILLIIIQKYYKNVLIIFVSIGELCESIVTVPLYLTQLRVSIVNGIKDQQVNVWKTYKRKINEKCSKINYNGEFGNQGLHS